MNYLYLLIDLLTISIPFIFSFHYRIRFDRYFIPFLISASLVAIFFLIWDAWFVSMGVWGFSPYYTLGISFQGLVIEEILFFYCIPFSCVFTYYCIVQHFRPKLNPRIENIITSILTSILIIIAIVFNDRLYTFYTALFTATTILIFHFTRLRKELYRLYLIYPFLLIPFFIVNGILTGTGLDHPVVWYNDSENLSLRLGTIPIEDVSYGFLLILGNIGLMQIITKGKFDKS